MSNNPIGNLPSGTLYTFFNTKEDYMTWFHSDSEKLQLPNRHCLPNVYQVRNHIKAPRYGSYLGKLYIALIDSSPGHINKVAQYLETANKWYVVMNGRLNLDIALTKKKWGCRGLGRLQVLQTWTGLIQDEESLPEDWIDKSGVLVGRFPLRHTLQDRAEQSHTAGRCM